MEINVEDRKNHNIIAMSTTEFSKMEEGDEEAEMQ